METGIVYSPLLFSKLTFDKEYIIFKDYTSLTAGDNKYHTYLTGLSTGVFVRYRMPHIYFQGEVNFFENKFRKNIPDWKTSRDKYFTYSALEVPLFCGLTINPGSLVKIRFFGGINNRIGRFRTVFFSSITLVTDQNSNQNYYYYADATRKDELMKKFNNYYMDIIGGIGFSYYSNALDIRFEKNITELNKETFLYNANYKDLIMIRVCYSFTLFNPWIKKSNPSS
ncbi:MAG: hypothetical protein CVU05_00310 [Bacteroidetes bacterium HGW-Bacteroidetes-21]|nr:MAG: hypothetical protein CVU05_00310 [Bacteroidetes bacterium HGW-Bacteroidetes-21]